MKRLLFLMLLCACVFGQQSNTSARNPNYLNTNIQRGTSVPATCLYNQLYVKTDTGLLRQLDINYLQGDYSLATEVIGWKPWVDFEELVKLMVSADMSRWERYLRGESFAWDAPGYPE